ncbi:MAG: di-trans,poly-cis-decaprenylcistransferase [Candidatus Pelagibacter sp.]|nr:di-trans,poly-cis-decaprenylcistransferase [Candidatus Pelagibacter sp.]
MFKSEKTTKNNKRLLINLALNYGSRNELIFAFKNVKRKKLKITENNINNNLFTNKVPEPDILIRTGNTHRLSNFLLWQIAYSEIFFVKKLWPEFNSKDFNRIIFKFKNIKRNFGSVR